MLRFCSLGSGSSGNATVIEGSSGASVQRLLVDCGFGPRQLAQRLARAGLACTDLDAIFITHEHSDHVGCALSFAQHHGIALWMSAGTHAAIGSPAIGPLLHLVRDGEPIDLGVLEARPFTVPHDAREPLQLRCSDGAKHLGIATDFGHATPHVLACTSAGSQPRPATARAVRLSPVFEATDWRYPRPSGQHGSRCYLGRSEPPWLAPGGGSPPERTQQPARARAHAFRPNPGLGCERDRDRRSRVRHALDDSGLAPACILKAHEKSPGRTRGA